MYFKFFWLCAMRVTCSPFKAFTVKRDVSFYFRKTKASVLAETQGTAESAFELLIIMDKWIIISTSECTRIYLPVFLNPPP